MIGLCVQTMSTLHENSSSSAIIVPVSIKLHVGIQNIQVVPADAKGDRQMDDNRQSDS